MVKSTIPCCKNSSLVFSAQVKTPVKRKAEDKSPAAHSISPVHSVHTTPLSQQVCMRRMKRASFHYVGITCILISQANSALLLRTNLTSQFFHHGDEPIRSFTINAKRIDVPDHMIYLTTRLTFL